MSLALDHIVIAVADLAWLDRVPRGRPVLMIAEGLIPYLTEADAGVSTHHEHIETTYSFRTRILDYLWASLPIVATDLGTHETSTALTAVRGRLTAAAPSRRRSCARRVRCCSSRPRSSWPG